MTDNRPLTDDSQLRQQVTSWHPKLLSDDQAAALRPQLVDLLLTAGVHESRQVGEYLATISRFVADTHPGGQCPVPGWLTDAVVATWSRHRVAAGTKPTTVARHVTRLNRLLAAQRGVPAPGTQTRSAHKLRHILSTYAAAAYAEAVRFDVGAAASVITTAGTGLGPKATAGGTLRRRDDGWVLDLPDGSRRALLSHFDTVDLPDPITLALTDWDRAMYRAHMTIGRPLRAVWLQQGWLATALSEPIAARDLLAAGVRTDAIDQAIHYSPGVHTDRVRSFLRDGCDRTHDEHPVDMTMLEGHDR